MARRSRRRSRRSLSPAVARRTRRPLIYYPLRRPAARRAVTAIRRRRTRAPALIRREPVFISAPARGRPATAGRPRPPMRVQFIGLRPRSVTRRALVRDRRSPEQRRLCKCTNTRSEAQKAVTRSFIGRYGGRRDMHKKAGACEC